jgi:sulfatase maturation enzyme AslB (radical SAM superfamily)
MDAAKKFSNSMKPSLKVRVGPSGLHFFNRLTGINVLFDEITPPKRAWSPAPRQVSIALTNNCDLNCPHCYAPKSPGMIDYNDLTNWLSELDLNGCIGVGFGGGEPTLYPKLAELCSYTSHKTKLAVIMTTHAHRLTDHLLNRLKGNLHFVRVSMDGVGSTYESIRRRPFETLLERIRALARITDFGINYVVNAKTIKDIDAAANLADELGAAEFLLIPEVPVGRGKGCDNDTVIKLHSWVYHYRGSVPLAVSEGSAEGLPTCNPFKNETGLASFAHIDAHGVMKRTSYNTSGIHIREDGVIAALYRLKAIKREMA